MRNMELIRDPAAVSRLRLAFDLSETGFLIMEQNLRRRYPEASESEIRQRLTAWIQKRPFIE
jgi:Rv0078B-related antitoxin